MLKHTPGNWVAVGAWVEHADDTVADICSCDPETLGQGHHKRDYDEMCANARLIAAAPELLFSLQETIGVIRTMINSDELRKHVGIKLIVEDVLRDARLAIAKVKGEQ